MGAYKNTLLYQAKGKDIKTRKSKRNKQLKCRNSKKRFYAIRERYAKMEVIINLKREIAGIPKEKIRVPEIPIPTYIEKVKEFLKENNKGEKAQPETGMPIDIYEETLMLANYLMTCETEYQEELEINIKLKNSNEWILQNADLCKLKIELLYTFINRVKLPVEYQKELTSLLKQQTGTDEIEQIEKIIKLAYKMQDELIILNYKIEELKQAETLIEKIKAEQEIALEQSLKLLNLEAHKNQAYTLFEQKINSLKSKAEYDM